MYPSRQPLDQKRMRRSLHRGTQNCRPRCRPTLLLSPRSKVDCLQISCHWITVLRKTCTCLINVHPPQGPANKVLISTTRPVTLVLVDDGVHWRSLVSTEALSSPLDSGEGVALVLFLASSDALRRRVVPWMKWIDFSSCITIGLLGLTPWLAEVLRQQSRLSVFYALTVPGGTWIFLIVYYLHFCFVYYKISNIKRISFSF